MSAARGLRERLRWDAGRGAILDGGTRYLMIRADSLMGLFARLGPAVREAALEAFRASLREHGARSAARYRDAGGGDREALIAAIERGAADLGWGRWRLRDEGGGRVLLEVDDSPFAAGHGPADGPVCAPIAGMLEAVAGLLLGEPASARELECAAGGAARCRFEARADR